MSTEFGKNTEEEKYFQLQETERRAAIRTRLDKAAEEARERREMAETLHTTDEAIIERLRAMHFDKDTARVLDLIPLVHVAWADGSVTTQQRSAVLDILHTRGIEGHSEAFLLIETLLEKRPSEAFLDETLDLLHDMLGEESERSSDVVDLCVRVADASGGFFGFGDRISEKERAEIVHIVEKLGTRAREEFAALMARRG